MRVFISSTYEDLIEHRRSASEALMRLGQTHSTMEVFGARPQDAREASLAEIDRCDIFVGIYAYRYGYVPEGSECSITELEFLHAEKTKKPLLCFVVNEDHPWPPKMIEGETARTKLEDFKKLISKKLVLDTFTTPADLALKVATSTGRYIAEVSSPLFGLETGLRSLAESRAASDESEKRATAEALAAAVQIATQTLQYIAKAREAAPDLAEERTLAEGWNRAGLKLMELRDPPGSLAKRYFLKAEYWSDPSSWTDERIDSANIRLEAVAKESRALLLDRAATREPSRLGMPNDETLLRKLEQAQLTETQKNILKELISPMGTKVSKPIMSLSVMYSKAEINELFHLGFIMLIGRDVVVAHDAIASFFARELYDSEDM